MFKKCLAVFLFMFLAAHCFASVLTLDELLVKVQGRQKQVTDMYAETVTVITSNMSVPGQESKEPQKIAQKGKMWTKGEKSRIEMLEPTRQITINDGKKIAVINKMTGQKYVQDLSKDKIGRNSQNMSLEKAKEYFNLSLKSEGNNYIVTGVPKEKNKIFGRMEFVISAGDLLPSAVLMYTPDNKLISKTVLQYQKINSQMVPVKNISDVATPMGSMHIEMEYKNVKVNEGISDSLFEIK